MPDIITASTRTRSEVEQFVKTLRTYMDLHLDEQRDNFFRLMLDTRDNGDIGEEEPGEADIAEARRVSEAIAKQFPDLNVRRDYCDEWVHVMIDNGPKRYGVTKLKEISGFEHGIGGINELAYTYRGENTRNQRAYAFTAKVIDGVTYFSLRQVESIFGVGRVVNKREKVYKADAKDLAKKVKAQIDKWEQAAAA